MSDPTKPVPRKTRESHRVKTVGPNLREELQYLVDRTGFIWMGLRQPDYSRPSSDADEAGADYGGSRTTRTGYVFTDHLVKAFTWQSNLGVKFESGVGHLSTQGKNLVIEHDRPINKFDLVLQLDTDPDTGDTRQPFSIIRVFEIQDVLPLIGDGSRVEFWKCNIEERNLDDSRVYIPGQANTPNSNRNNYI